MSVTDPGYVESYRQRLDDIQQRAQGASAQLGEIMATAHSDDRSVSVTVNPSGGLQDLQLSKGVEGKSAQQLQRLILDTAHKAQAEAGRQVEEAMQPLLGESEGMDFLRSQLAREPEADSDASQGRPQVDDDDDGDEGFKGLYQ